MDENFKIRIRNIDNELNTINPLSPTEIEIIANGHSLTGQNPAIDYPVLFLKDAVNKTAAIRDGKRAVVTFKEYPPNKLIFSPTNDRKVRITVLHHNTGEPLNKQIPKNEIEISRSEVVNEIIDTAEKLVRVSSDTEDYHASSEINALSNAIKRRK